MLKAIRYLSIRGKGTIIDNFTETHKKWEQILYGFYCKFNKLTPS